MLAALSTGDHHYSTATTGLWHACLRGVGHLATSLGAEAASYVVPALNVPSLVKDFSDGGVRLQSNGFEVPDEFVLLFAPNELAQSGRDKVVWRLGNDVGAKFLGSCR